MIKNLLIAFLILAVMGLSWIAFSDTHGKSNDMVSVVRNRVNELKQQLANVVRPAIQERVISLNTGLDKKKEKSDEEPLESQEIIPIRQKNQTEILRQNEAKLIRPMLSENSGPAEVLAHIKPEPGKDQLTDEELNAVLTLLKSAQKTLRKTSFPFRPECEERNTAQDQSEPRSIKKKSSDGPEKSG